MWLAWAVALVGVLWLRAAPPQSGRAAATTLALSAVIAGASICAIALRHRITARRLWVITGAVLAGSVALTGEPRGWLGAAVVPALALGPGLLVLRVLVRDRPPAFVVLAAGLAVLAHLGLAASLLGLFSPWLFAGVSVASWALYAASGPGTPAPTPPMPREATLSAPAAAAVGGLWALLAILVLQAALPECCGDAVWKHLPLAEAIAERRYVAVPELWWTMVPHAYHMLAGIAYAVGGVMAAKLLHFAFLLANVGWAIWLGGRLYGLASGLIAAGLFLTIPLVMWNGTVGSTDMGATFFTMGGITALLEFVRSGRAGWLPVAGALAGTAVAMRYSAAVVLVPMALVLLIEQARMGGARRILRGCAALAAGAAITAGPWLARTALLTGNPVFPGFDEAYWVARVPRGAMGTFPLLWLPVLASHWRGIGREGWYLSLIAAGHFASIAPFAGNPRYQLISWLALAVVLAGALGAPGALGVPRHGPGRALVAGVVVAALTYSLASWLAFFPVRPTQAYLVGVIDRQEFLRRTVPALGTYERMRRLVPRDGRILTDGLHATWHARRHLIPSWLPLVRPLFTRPNLSREDALGIIRAHGLRYFLAPSTRRHRILDLGLYRPVLDHEGFTLYELAPGVEGRPPQPA